MKIAVESSVLARQNKTGVDYYVQDLLNATVKVMPSSQFILCYLSFFTKQTSELGIKHKNVKFKRVKYFPGKLYNFVARYLFGMPYDLLCSVRADIMLYPNFIYWPLARIKKSVVVVYDLAYIDAPQTMIPRHQKYLKKFVPSSIRKATHIVTISEHAKSRIIANYKTKESKITVINPAIDHSIYRPLSTKEIERVKKKYKIDSDYLLYLGTIEPRKNIEGIIKAYRALSPALQQKYKLILAGGKGWLDEDINNLIHALGDRVIRTGYVDNVDKPALYSGAKLFLYPSHYEGWGMQILESMACGTPVITANNSSLPEVGGDAAVYVKAGKNDQLTVAIKDLLNYKTEYNKYVALGLKQAKKFSWEKSGLQLKKVFEKVYNQ